MATINNTKSNTLLSGTSEDDTIQNGGWWDDSYHSGGSNVTINTGAGNDSVLNRFGESVTINTGEGNDSVKNYGSSVTINTGAGNDSVFNGYSSSVTINTGDGNDFVYNEYVFSVTISGGKGNDSIYNNCYRKDDGSIYYYNDNYGNNMVFKYEEGDGNDIIYGFKDNSTLSISGGSYSTIKSGSDIIFTVDDGKITLENVICTADKLHINDRTTSLSKLITLTSGNDSIYNCRNLVTINTGAGNDSVENFGSSVTISGGKGNDSIYNNCFRGDDGSIYYYYDDLGNNVLFKYEEGEGNDIIYGFKANSTLSISGSSYSSEKRGDDIIFTVGDGKISLIGAASLSAVNIVSGETPIETNSWRISGTTATYGTATNTLITVSGVKSLDGLSLSGTTVTVAKSSLGTGKVKISGEGYTLKLGSDVAAPTTTAGKWTLSSTTATYKSASNTAGYTLASNSKSISYTAATSATTLTTVKGVKSTGGLAIDTASKTVTVSAASLNKKTVTISNGYTLKLAAGVDTIKEDLTAWTTLDSGNVAYVAGGTGDYYSLSGSNKITYHKAVAGTNKVELSGVKGTPTLSGNTVSLGADNFASNVSVVSNAGNYIFYLKSNIKGKKFTGGAGKDSVVNWGDSVTINTGDGNDYVYNNSGSSVTINTGEGDDSIKNYGDSVTISGGKGNDSIYNNWNFTTGKAYADSYGSKVVFKYETGDGNDIIYGFKANSTLSISGGSYSTAESGDDIIFTVGEGKISLIGAKSLSTVNIVGTEKPTVNPFDIVGKATADTISNSLAGATLQALGGNDSIKNTASKVSIVGDSGKDTIINSGASVTVDSGADNDKISNTGAKVSIFGGAGNDSIKNTAKSVKIFAGDGNDTIVNSKGASVSIDAGKGNDKISNTGTSVSIFGGVGNDSIKNTAKTVKIFAGDGADTVINSGASVSIDEGAGNDLISLSSAAKNNLIVYRAGDGSDTIYGFNADDTLRIGDGTNTYSDTVSGDDLIVTVGEGKITLRGAASLSTVNINGKKVNSDKPYDSTVIIDGKKITLTEDYITPNFNVADYGELLMTIDATAVVRDLNIKANDLANYIKGSEQNDTIEGGGAADTINGNAGNDSIIGGSGNDLLFGDDDDDTLSGGSNNDTLYGGAGDDVFIYTAGKDVIEDYTPEEDRIHIAEGKITSSVISGSDVTFTIDSKSKLKLTVKDGKYKAITFVDANDKETISVPGAAIVNKSNYTAPTTAEYIDGTAWKKNATITGNTFNNTILGSVSYNNTIYGGDGNDSIVGGKVKNNLNGGYGNDTLVGSAGNDMLTGNEGDDVFIYTAGKDVITDYTEGDDIISLGAATLEDVTATRSGSDGILNIGTGTLTISKAKGKTVKIMDKDGKDTLIAFSPNVTLTNANSSLFSADEGDEQIDASARTIKIQIKGNELDNTILGSTKGDTIYGEVGADSLVGGDGNDKLYGGSDNDTLIGGKGNDTLWGGLDKQSDDCADVFIYNAGDGKDTIIGFDEDDVLQLVGISIDDITPSQSKTAIVFTIDTNNSITFKQSATNTYNINGEHYSVTGYQFEKVE